MSLKHDSFSGFFSHRFQRARLPQREFDQWLKRCGKPAALGLELLPRSIHRATIRPCFVRSVAKHHAINSNDSKEQPE